MNRFLVKDETVADTRTGLMWTRNASLFDFPMGWEEALRAVKERSQSGLYGHCDWRLPNRRELFSLVSHESINPSVPKGHPFANIFTGYYWTSSTCARLPKQAWYIYFGGARVFKGMKYGSYMVWPVRTQKIRNTSPVLQTGQQRCFDESGVRIDCLDSGQDGEFRFGLPTGKNRFTADGHAVYDNATERTWLQNANIHERPVDWQTALDLVSEMNRQRQYGHDDWRVPGIVELESLTDMGRHSPALPAGHLFSDVQDCYWSSTTSRYDTDYAWTLYIIDGAVGVGYKPLTEFYLWPVRSSAETIVR